MSELTPCCHCELKRIRRHAAKTGARVVIRPAEGRMREVLPKAVEIYLVPAGTALSPDGEIPEVNGAPLDWVAMLGEVTEECAC